MMKEKRLTRTSLCNGIGALLMLILLILQFTPFWQYGEEGETASIGAYVWFPTENTAVGTAIKEAVGDDFSVENIVGIAVLVLLLSAAGVVVCVIQSKAPAAGALPIACGVVGMYGFLTKPALRLGMNWGLHVALCAAMLVAGILSICLGTTGKRSQAAGEPAAA